jgi:hypothetical protein
MCKIKCRRPTCDEHDMGLAQIVSYRTEYPVIDNVIGRQHTTSFVVVQDKPGIESLLVAFV